MNSGEGFHPLGDGKMVRGGLPVRQTCQGFHQPLLSIVPCFRSSAHRVLSPFLLPFEGRIRRRKPKSSIPDIKCTFFFCPARISEPDGSPYPPTSTTGSTGCGGEMQIASRTSPCVDHSVDASHFSTESRTLSTSSSGSTPWFFPYMHRSIICKGRERKNSENKTSRRGLGLLDLL
jgi:hypothetical protein